MEGLGFCLVQWGGLIDQESTGRSLLVQVFTGGRIEDVHKRSERQRIE